MIKEIFGENAHNLPACIHHTKSVGLLPGMASGYITRPHLSGCDCLGSARQSGGFPLNKNSSLKPINCEQFVPLSAANSIIARGVIDDRAASLPVVSLMLQRPASLFEFPISTVAVKLEDDSGVRIGLPAIEAAVRIDLGGASLHRVVA